jgi:glucose/arabinose dehydrogenase
MQKFLILAGALCVVVAGCSNEATLPVEAGIGPQPQLPPPERRLVPVVNVAPAVGWPTGARPLTREDLAVNAYAGGLEHPRWLYVLPNGDVLVAETNAPERPDDRAGVRGWFAHLFMKKAGAAASSPDRITLLRDADGDGVAEVRESLLEHLNSPFGMTLVGDTLYVANTDALIGFAYRRGDTTITAPGRKVVDLPAGPLNHHWTKNVIASRDGARLYVTVGSNSNVGENGLDREAHRAAILEVDPAAGTWREFATGLRNPNGMGWHPATGRLWTVVNERDELGGDLVPDYLTEVDRGDFFGWPYSYFGAHVDERVTPERPDLVASARVPDYALGPHTASLGLVFYDATLFPPRYRGGAFVGQHGSWNRKPLSGYKVIFVPFEQGRPSAMPEDVLWGFIDAAGRAQGRPVGVAVDARGALLVADDVGNTVWRVVPQHGTANALASTTGS